MDTFSIESRRYIGNKAKLIDWIMEVIGEEASDAQSFCDILQVQPLLPTERYQNTKRS